MQGRTPRIIRRNGFLDFRDSRDSNVALIRASNETLENLEKAYFGLQRAYEDDMSISKITYLRWAGILEKKGLDIDLADKAELSMLLHNAQEYIKRSA